MDNEYFEKSKLVKNLWKSVYRDYLSGSSNEELQLYISNWEKKSLMARFLHAFNPFAHYPARAEAAREILEERAKIR
jgi:hypothetical protein